MVSEEVTPWTENFLERGCVPDWIIRMGIRRLLARRLREEARGGAEKKKMLIEEMKSGPIAVHTADANDQHYEVHPEFFALVLGGRMKYSGGYWPPGVVSLDHSEEAMLDLYCERADMMDGLNILELGCGWGSLSLYMAERYPNARIVGVSNSGPQKEFIEDRASSRGLKNLKIITADMNVFDAGARFDRVVSIEMFEHMRNYERLLSRISGWMSPGAKLFIHIFSHARFAYFFEDRDSTDWMARYFFTGGIMPSDDLLDHFQNDMKITARWRVDGTHYQKTSEAWLSKMDSRRPEIFPLFVETYGPDRALRMWVYWRIFFMSCAELFGYRRGQEWGVSHYLLERSQ